MVRIPRVSTTQVQKLKSWAQTPTPRAAILGTELGAMAMVARDGAVRLAKWILRKVLNLAEYSNTAESAAHVFELDGETLEVKKSGRNIIFSRINEAGEREKAGEIRPRERAKSLIINDRDYFVLKDGKEIRILRPDPAVEGAYIDINIATRILESEGRGRSIANGDAFERPVISPEIAEKLGDPELAGEPGGLLRINPDKKVVFVGDLHGNIDNLRAIINQYGKDLQDGKITLVLLGDAVHNDCGNLAEMHSSKEILDIILQLKSEYPDNFHYMKGNHDSFSPVLAKSDNEGNEIQQGVKHRNHLLQERGEEYVKKVERFWEHCPLAVMIGDTVFAAHSSVVKGGASQTDIIGAYYSPGLCRRRVTKTEELEYFIERNSYRYSYDDASGELVVKGRMEMMEVYELMSIVSSKTEQILIQLLYSASQLSSIEDQLQWNRPDAQYRNDDAIAMRKKLGLRPDAALVSGHDKKEEPDSAYEQPGMPNHFILQSQYDQKVVPLYVLEVDKGKVKKVEVAPLQDEPAPARPQKFIDAKTNYGFAS